MLQVGGCADQDRPQIPVPDELDVGQPDSGRTDGAAPGEDIPPDPDIPSELAQFGEACIENADCQSGYCVASPGGYVCTQACRDECPAGWHCRGLSQFGADPAFMCMPPEDRSCLPCLEHADCGADGLCVKIDPGEPTRYCLSACSAATCATGYTCQPLVLDGEELGDHCLPTTGTCSCNDFNDGLDRLCEQKNEFGRCLGRETCRFAQGWVECNAPQPQAEVCNGKDDDCSGLVDDVPLLGTACERTAELPGEGRRSCIGVLACQEGQPELQCTAPEPAPELCNGRDDNCDGATDEAFPDLGTLCTTGTGMCLRTGVWLCSPTGDRQECSVLPGDPAAEELCDGRDNDCDGETDEGFRDVQGRYVTEEHCGACGQSCIGIIPHATARCAAEPQPNCLVDRCDAGYYAVSTTTCLPATEDACQPCAEHANCGVPGNRCLELDGGRFCGRDCGPGNRYGTPAGECPVGFICEEVEPRIRQCVPTTGSCTCRLPDEAGHLRSCIRTSAIGRCTGLQSCDPTVGIGWSECSALLPAAETCNGVDDDCNGFTDDEVEPPVQPCVHSNAAGSCGGEWVCDPDAPAEGAGERVDGWRCVGPNPRPEECNGADDDCDGETDEEFRDPVTGRYDRQEHCGVCHHTCEGAIQDAEATACDATGGSPFCYVLHCREGYYIPPNNKRICVPIAGASDCSPCSEDGHCSTLPDGRCEALDGGRFCTRSCAAEADCPAGTGCQEGRCWPLSGSCTCMPVNVNDVRACFSANVAGTCQGTQRCDPDARPGWSACTAQTPALEACNGRDDDCNGLVDEGVVHDPVQCSRSNDQGTCTGPWSCGGEQGWRCLAAEPAAEQCNLRDDDCDGETDEEFRDPVTGFYDDVDHCGACGYSCHGQVAHAAVLGCATDRPTPTCVVEECEPGYFRAGDFACLPVTDGRCEPCLTDDDCPVPGDRCLLLDGEHVCGYDCGAGNLHGTPAGTCPGDARCEVQPDGGQQCVPPSGSCSCLAEEAGQTRPCARTAPPGTCYGLQTCDPALGWSQCTAAVPALETCNGVDDDCDTVVDDVAGRGGACTNANGNGSCPGVRDCVAGQAALVCVGPLPATEVCNGRDEDCDGQTDEGALWADLNAICTVGQGICARTGIKTCNSQNPAGASICSVAAGQPAPGGEVCNGADDDCDGQTDEGALWADLNTICTVGQGLCARTGIKTCNGANPAGASICSVAAGQPAPGGEVCNGVDDDCDGQTDEGALWADRNSVCSVGQGICVRSGLKICNTGNPGGATVCSVTPGQPAAGGEVCNGVDDDCDGSTDEGATWADLGTVCTVGQGICVRSGIKSCNGANPAGATICAATPGQPAPGGEVCNGVDDDCDGQIDEGALWADRNTVCTVGQGICVRSGIKVCNGANPSGATVCNATPGQPAAGGEVCNSVDDDCDGQTDEGAAWADLNTVCTVGQGLCARNGIKTCNAANPGGASICSVAPGQPAPGGEVCNGLDDDCDGQTDEGALWADRNTVCSVGQGICVRSGLKICNTGNPGGATVCSATPGQPAAGGEVCNGVDDDCDGSTDEGAAWADLGTVCSVGQGICVRSGIKSCNGANPGGATICAATPGQPAPGGEVCNGVDDDCDGSTDEGATWADLGTVCSVGQGICVRSGIKSCNGANPAGATICAATPGQPAPGGEVCNGVDDDCDGQTDEGALWADLSTVCTVGKGICQRSGIKVCNGANPGGATVCNATPGQPAAGGEVCNGVDDDCDGLTDEGAIWLDQGLVCTVGEGICQRSGIKTCDPADARGETICAATPGQPAAGGEVCNGLDDDCDGQTDEQLAAPACPLTAGVCAGSKKVCGGSLGWLDCTAASYGAKYEPNETLCDGLNNDCDLLTDEVDLDGDGHRPTACGGDDCDDRNPLAYRGAPEICGDAVDNDCNGKVDDRDGDGDGVVAAACGGTDCNDASAAARPGLVEVCGDRLDNDCDGSIDNRDIDGDGFWDQACGGIDCDDTKDTVYPGADETCNGLDDDCNNEIDDKDDDRDGHRDKACGGDDCNDADPLVNPARQEVCGNPVDEDCSGKAGDKDLDRDGHVDADPACVGGDDCNDLDPSINPALPEQYDTKDNDCDGLVDESFIPVGAVIVTEMMPNPDRVDDTLGEWFEVYNRWTFPVNLHSWKVQADNGVENFTIRAPAGLVLQPGQSIVLCTNRDRLTNGGLACDYEYVFGQVSGTMTLANGADTLNLYLDGTRIDRVSYASSSVGKTSSLDPNSYDAGANDVAANWCAGKTAYGDGDLGSPKVINPLCAGSVAVTSVWPGDGVDNGGETILIRGAGFTGTTDVKLGVVSCTTWTLVDDTTLRCVTPAGNAGSVGVTVVKGAQSDTLANGYRYTGEAVVGINWCDLQWPRTVTVAKGQASELIYGQVRSPGVTEPAGAPAGILAQVGYGPSGSDPRNQPGWLWSSGIWHRQFWDNDEYKQTLTVDTPGTYSLGYRFSDDGGLNFMYCDFDPGTADGFTIQQLGTLTVQ